MLLNRRMIGFGEPAQVFTPENLLDAFGGHLHLAQFEGETMAMGDACCEDESR